MIDVKKLANGDFVVSDSGTWIPGVYSTEQLAKAAAKMDCDKLDVLWKTVLESGRYAITEKDMEIYQ